MKYKYIGKVDFEYEINSSFDETYDGALDKLHPELIWKHITVGCCSGDIISLGYDKETKEFFYKLNSYGSCSGCDWIYGIETQSEAEKFYKSQEVLDPLGTNIIKVKEYLEKETKNVYEFEENELEQFYNFIDMVIK